MEKDKERGRPRLYSVKGEKEKAYKERHNIQKVSFDVREDAPVNKLVLKKAADALDLPLTQFIMQAAIKHILDQLGPEWLEENQNKEKE